ncbi:putative bifunctional diguanylate cyclase/phosphodiesterase [Noviherbaspirillum aerium]|uniref:putative bifunctional diguanylate cyclase/phosphodiesterase n=1 Tax=Noviherbaspirillum aerium TaxID=2588497 RepID=UPI00124C8CF2|nr:EAL domain-containing protein [Noviherbaspirillum aerium]
MPYMPFSLTKLSRYQTALETLLRALSLFAVPVIIVLISIIALVFWDNHYAAKGDRPLELRVWSGQPSLALAEARDKVDLVAPVKYFNTDLSEEPVWFGFTASGAPGRYTVEFPSRHATEIACWDAIRGDMLGSGSRSITQGQIKQAKAGFALDITELPSKILCKASFAGPARLTASLWPSAELDHAIQHYHRKSGLLDGGLTVLAVFVLVTALMNRQSLNLLFAAWLFVNLRVGALSAGWDTQWLGQEVPEQWILFSRAFMVALYALLTLTLYQELFREDLARTKSRGTLVAAQWLCPLLLLASIALPFRHFLPVMWVMAGLGLLLMMVSLTSVIRQSRSRVALWYAASFGVTFVTSLLEVVAAASGRRELVGLINSVTGALLSSLLTALALAEQMRQEQRQRMEAQAQLRHAYEVMPIGLFTLDGRGQFVSANAALNEILGTNVLTAADLSWQQYFEDNAWTRLHGLVHGQQDRELELRSRAGDRRFLVKATLAQEKIEGFLQDVTEKAKATEELRFMANNDPLTRVFNRRGIEDAFKRSSPTTGTKPLTLAYLDLDRFKLINDLFGHAAGDEVLKQVCQRIGAILPSSHSVGRVGGDEFLIVMPDTALPLATLICRGLVETIGNTPYRVADKAFHVRGSVGLIDVSPEMPIKDAMSTADRACREAKAAPDGLVVYEKNASAFHEREMELGFIERLSGHDATNDLFLEMQPIMSLRAPQESLNFEVLLRMRDRDGSTIPAGRIIGAAEKCGRTGVIDRWVLSTTLGWIETNYERLQQTQFVCLNLSGASLNDERFVQDALSILADHPKAAKRVCIEITESVALHDLNNTRRFIDQVCSYGAKIGLDDFGAGYTSFSYLKELPADVLKIDGNFVVNINAHPANVAIVEAIVNLAVNLGMKTIAEWAEDAATVETLAEIGVDYVQGYVISRSQPPDKLLTASSSTSFITDETLLTLVQRLGSNSDILASAPNVVRLGDLH